MAFPWRRRGAAEALGREVAPLLHEVGGRRSVDRLLAEAAERVAAAEPGDEPDVPEPEIPVVSVTGTNGKTTTVRLLAHLVRSAGRSVAYSSTDGVYRGDGELIEEGDYSGFGGAARALGRTPRRRRPGDRARRHPAPRDRRAPQRRRGRDERVRGPPGPPRHPDDRPALGGEGDGHADHPAGGMGRAERGRPPGPVDAPGRDGQAVALLARSLAPGDPRHPGRRRPRDRAARRVDDRARRLVVTAARRADRRARSRSRASRATT